MPESPLVQDARKPPPLWVRVSEAGPWLSRTNQAKRSLDFSGWVDGVRGISGAAAAALRARGRWVFSGPAVLSADACLRVLDDRSPGWPTRRITVLEGVHDAEGLRATGIVELIALPLPHDALGADSVVVLGLDEEHLVTSEIDLGALRSLADQVSWAISHALLEAETERISAELARQNAAPSTHEKDQLLSFIAHELRTPLTPMMMLLQSLERKGRAGQFDLEAVARTRRQALRLARLIGDLVDLAKSLEGRLELDRGPIDLVEIVTDTVSTLRPSMHRHELEVVLGLANLPLVGDRMRLERLVQNLVEQAERLVPGKGTLRISVDATGTEAQLSFGALGDGSAPKENLTRVASGGNLTNLRGANLGMYLAEITANLHGGSLEIEARPGALPEIVVLLPRAHPAPPA